MLQHHHGRVSRALLELFPHIGYEKTELWARGIPPSYRILNLQHINILIDLKDCRDAKKRSKLFEEFARVSELIPSLPDVVMLQATSKLSYLPLFYFYFVPPFFILILSLSILFLFDLLEYIPSHELTPPLFFILHGRRGIVENAC